MTECTLSRNVSRCTCTYEPCSRKGRCCECVQYHLRAGEVPGCFFPPEAEATYDRSAEHFAQVVSRRK